MTGKSKSSQQIEDEIRDTQKRINRRVEDLQSSLSPSKLFSQIFSGLGETGEDVAAGVMQVVRRNPGRSAMVGAGVLWLLGSAAALRNGVNAQSGTTARGSNNGRKSANGSAAERVGEGLSDVADTISESAADARRRVNEASDQAVRSAKAATARTGDAIKSMPDQVRSASRQGVEWTKANPIPTGLMCIAAGAALASVFTMARAGNDNASATNARATKSTKRKPAAKKKPARRAAASKARSPKRSAGPRRKAAKPSSSTSRPAPSAKPSAASATTGPSGSTSSASSAS